MRRRRLLSGCLIGIFVFILTIPSIYAQDYTVDSDVGETSYDMNTRYDAKEYIRKVETYDVDIVWDDLHWIFVYEGDIANPNKSIWMSKANYNSSRTSNDDNIYNYEILSDTNRYSGLEVVDIYVINNSDFAVDITTSIEQVDNVANYTNSAELKVSADSGISYGNEATLVSLNKNADGLFWVKPTATRYINDSNTTVSVSGEVKVSFSKTM